MNVTQQIESVTRSLADRQLESGPGRVATISQTFPVSQARLWEIASTAEHIAGWFLPISGNLELGGHYQLEGNAGGTIETCNPPHSFSATWEHGGNISWISVTVTEIDANHARFTLEHTAPVTHEIAGFWEQFGPGAVGIGWDSGLLGLSLYLTSPGERPTDPSAWLITDDGKRFCRLSADAWRDAHITTGADPDFAQRAADNSYNAYTATPE